MLIQTDTPAADIRKWRAIGGLLILLAITAAVFRKGGNELIGAGFASGVVFLPIASISLFFVSAHPMNQYAAVLHTDSPDGVIKDDGSSHLDEVMESIHKQEGVYHRWAPIVKKLESEGSIVSKSGGSFWIERYLYSPRIGILFGKYPGEDKGSPDIGYEIRGVSAWLFGIRVACEQFAFFAINLAPLLIVYGFYCQWKSKPPKDSLTIDPAKALFLTGPFMLGLIPLIGT